MQVAGDDEQHALPGCLPPGDLPAAPAVGLQQRGSRHPRCVAKHMLTSGDWELLQVAVRCARQAPQAAKLFSLPPTTKAHFSPSQAVHLWERGKCSDGIGPVGLISRIGLPLGEETPYLYDF